MIDRVSIWEYIDRLNELNPNTRLKSVYQLEDASKSAEAAHQFQTAETIRSWKELFFKRIEEEHNAAPFSPNSCDWEDEGWVHEDELPFDLVNAKPEDEFWCPRGHYKDTPQHFYGCGEYKSAE